MNYYIGGEGGSANKVAKHPSYVVRNADKELSYALKEGIYCYVLCPRQSGKTSLMHKFIIDSNDIDSNDFVFCIVISLEDINSTVISTHQKLYRFLIDEIKNAFNNTTKELNIQLRIENNQYHQDLEKSSGTQVLQNLLEQEIFNKIPNRRIVIFIDEIDALKSLQFSTDDFLAFIRKCCNNAGHSTQYEHLSFCLLGVTEPNELIRDKNRTPFNIGKSIELTPFNEKDTETKEALIRGFKNAQIPNYETLYHEVFYWTGGQPYLTMKLMNLIVYEYETEKPRSVDQIVNEELINDWMNNNAKVHLNEIQKQFFMRNNYQQNIFINLKNYSRILSCEDRVNWKDSNLAQESIDQLVLSGLVLKEKEYAKVYNPIYRKVFNFNWINEKLKEYKFKQLVNKKALIVIGDERVNENGIIFKKAQEIAKILEDNGEFKVVQLFHNVTTDILENSLVELFNSQEADLNTALFYFIGSGMSDRYGRHYKLKTDNNYNQDGLELWWLKSELLLSNIPQKIIWLDCTYSEKWINFSDVFPETKRELDGKTLDNFFITMSPKRQTIINPEDQGKLTEILYQELTENQRKNIGINSYYLAASISEKLYKNEKLQAFFEPSFMNVGSKPIDLILNQGQFDSDSGQKSEIRINETPYKGLQAFTEEDAQYFFGRGNLISRLFDELIKSNFLAVLGASGSGKSSVVKAGLVYQLKTGQRQSGFNIDTEIVVFRPGDKPLYNLLKALIEEKHLPNPEDIFHQLENPGSLEEVLNKLKVELSKLKKYSLTKLREFINQKSESGEDKVKDSLMLLIDEFEEEMTKTIQTRCSKLENYSLTSLRRLIAEYLEEDRIKNSLILVVDQFEEIFTMCNDEEERQQFFDCLLTANQYLDSREFYSTNSLKIIITMRSDFLPNCAKYPELQTQIDNYGVTVSNMTRANYIEAITEPAKKVGVIVEQSLEQTILEDLEDSFGALPLLQFVLQQLWEKFKEKKEIDNQTPDELTLENYHDLGGIKGTLHKRAEEVYTKKLTSKKEQKIAKQIFIELTQSVEDRDSNDIKLDLRRRLSKAELVKTLVNEKQFENDINNVIDILTSAKARLLIADKENVDIAHEALIRNWSRLKDWIDKNKHATKFRRDLEKVAQEWEIKGKKEELISVLSEKELNQAESYPIDAIPLSLIVQEYIKVSQRVRGKGSIAIRENTEIKLRDRANQIQRELFLDRNPDNQDTFKSVIELVRDNYQQKQNISILGSVKDVLYHFLNIIIKQKDGQIKLEQNIIEMKGHSDNITSVAISPDNKTIVSGSEDQTIRLWDINGNLINETFARENNKITSVAISSNGDIVSGSEDNTVRLRDKNLNQIAKYEHDKKVTSVAITPDGETIVSGSLDKKVRLCNREGDLIAEPFTKHQRFVYGVAITPDGKTIVSGSKDKTVCLWNRNGNLLKEFTAHQGAIKTMAISSDGQTVISGDTSGTVYWWDREDDLINKSPEEHKHNISVNSIAITPDGNITVTGGQDRRLRLWGRNQQLNEWVNIGTAIDVPWKVNSVAITADEKRIIIGGENKTMKLLYCGNWQDWLGIICLIYQRRGQYLDLCSQVQAELNLPSPDDLTKHFSKVLDK
jgi:WD40 repeat protein/ABC-type lipoprotein export system ATPase subunit